MLFGRRKPGYTTTVDGSADPEQAVLELQKAELAAMLIPVFFSAESAAPRAAFCGAGRVSVYVLAAARMAAASGSWGMGMRGQGSPVKEPMGFSNQTTSRQRPFL